jgi:predicted ATPase
VFFVLFFVLAVSCAKGRSINRSRIERSGCRFDINPARMTETTTAPPAFRTFGEMLRHLRRRARLTQRELGIAVGYSEAHIARLESGQRTPDPAVVSGVMIEALSVHPQSGEAAQLIALAETARSDHRGETPAVPERPPTNLRAQLTSFVGRQNEVVEVQRLLSVARLLTLTGSGGVGKTRLAVQVAAELLPTFNDGVWIVPLASVRVAEGVNDAIAMALGVQPAGEHATVEELMQWMCEKHAMLVLDTCEHLIDATATVAVRMVQACPKLMLLSTSREALNVPGEVTWQVPPMRVEEAMQLFMERARTVRPDFELGKGEDALLVQLCQQLDGLPLAIELAASRLRLLSLEQIAARLDDRFGLLTSSNRLAPLKQQTLRTMMDWSYDLLSDNERMMLRRLSIFTADWTIDLAEAICADNTEPPDRNDKLLQRGEVIDLLMQLVNKSLVIVDERGPQPHYSLSNTIRQYAHEKLVEAGEFDDVYRRYLQYLPFLNKTVEAGAAPKKRKTAKRRTQSAER